MRTVSKDNIWMYILAHTIKVNHDLDDAEEDLKNHPSSHYARKYVEICNIRKRAWEDIVDDMIGLWSLEEGEV